MRGTGLAVMLNLTLAPLATEGQPGDARRSVATVQSIRLSHPRAAQARWAKSKRK